MIHISIKAIIPNTRTLKCTGNIQLSQTQLDDPNIDFNFSLL